MLCLSQDDNVLGGKSKDFFKSSSLASFGTGRKKLSDWHHSLNLTFYNSEIYDQNMRWNIACTIGG